jgi:hypothetical protein
MSVQSPSSNGPKGGGGSKPLSCWTNQADKVAWILNTTGVAFLDLIELVPIGGQQKVIVDDMAVITEAVGTMGMAAGPAAAPDDLTDTAAGMQQQLIIKPEYKDAPVQDSLGLPLSPIGFFTHELGFVNQTIPISTQRAGMTSGFIYLPHGDTDIDLVNAWLDRCDQVGTSVLLDVRFDATIFGARGGPKPSPAVVKKALAATKAKVAALMHHQSVFAWYIADEPDGAHWDPAITSQVYQTVKQTDTKGRPVALCVDTTPSLPGSWQQFVPFTDIIMPDICE